MARLWRAPHLPFFLLAALWAGLVPLVWLWPGLSCDPVAWHRQELVLGFAGAAMGGYLLTALPHWLKRAGFPGEAVSPRRTAALVAAWGVGRLAGGSCVADGPALAGLALYPLGLTLCLVAPVARAGAWSRLPIAAAPLVLLLIAARLRLAADGLTAVLGMALLVALVGGRIVPAFLAARAGAQAGARADDHGPRRRLPWDARLADAALALALALHLAGSGGRAVGALLIAAAFGQALRMRRWPIAPVLAHRDLALLLCAWLWLPLGLALVGAGLSGVPDLPRATVLHGLTMGLMGSMVLAVMARSWMRRDPGRLRVDRPTLIAFGLLQLSTALRLAGGDPETAALAWQGAWALAAGLSTSSLFRPVPQPILSAARGA